MFEDNLTEAQTRKKIIDENLKKAGWDLKNPSMVAEEFEIAGTGAGANVLRLKDEKRAKFNPSGFSDYLLFDRAKEPLAIIEAKKTSREPKAGIKQAEDYADGGITFEQLSASVQGWVNHVRYGNTIGLRKAMFGSFVVQ